MQDIFEVSSDPGGLIKKDASFQGTEANDVAFQRLKNQNCEVFCLKYLGIPLKLVVLQIDTS